MIGAPSRLRLIRKSGAFLTRMVEGFKKEGLGRKKKKDRSTNTALLADISFHLRVSECHFPAAIASNISVFHDRWTF